jgi:hypothetical protein
MLTAAQRMQVRRHLGYHSVAQSRYPLIEGFASLNSILDDLADTPETEAEVVVILGNLDALETRINAAPARLAASQAEDVTLNGQELNQLWGEVRRWRRELSTLIGIPLHWPQPGAVMVA